MLSVFFYRIAIEQKNVVTPATRPILPTQGQFNNLRTPPQTNTTYEWRPERTFPSSKRELYRHTSERTLDSRKPIFVDGR